MAATYHAEHGTLLERFFARNRGPILVAPALAVLVIMNIFPLLWSFGLSFYRYRANRIKEPEFVWFKNYHKVLTDPVVWERFQTTAIIVTIDVLLQLIVGFLLALLFEKTFPGRRVLLMLVLTPMMLSFVAVGAFFRYYYEPTFGLLSQAVKAVTGEPFILLGSEAGALAGIIFADVWMWSPFVMLLVLAGLVSVPKHLYEAAEIDRASWWRRFWTITFPYIRGLLLLAILFRTIEAFKLFRHRVPDHRGRAWHIHRDHRRLRLSGGLPVLQDEPVGGARLYPALCGDRADQPLSLLRQTAGRGGTIGHGAQAA